MYRPQITTLDTQNGEVTHPLRVVLCIILLYARCTGDTSYQCIIPVRAYEARFHANERHYREHRDIFKLYSAIYTFAL